VSVDARTGGRAGELTVSRLAGSVGAIVSGLDLTQDLPPRLFDELRTLLSTYHVLVFKDQELSPEGLVAFARRWGPLSVHPRLKPLDGVPEVVEVYDATHVVATTWHQDQTFLAEPPSMTMLTAVTLPEAGGDTMFANQHLAFETLSATMQGVAVQLRAQHRRSLPDHRTNVVEHDEAVHPIAPHHPVTGRRALFVNADYTVGIDGMTAEESRPLLEFLYRHSVRPEFTCRHRWSPGDAVLWDNRSLLHAVVGDPTGPRLLHKVTMAGPRPV
jgi:taurine dioxygenase